MFNGSIRATLLNMLLEASKHEEMTGGKSDKGPSPVLVVEKLQHRLPSPEGFEKI